MEKLSKNLSMEIGKNTAIEFQRIYGRSSSLILGKYLKNNLGDDFANETRDALYAVDTCTSDLIDSIVTLARPQRDANPTGSDIGYSAASLAPLFLGFPAFASTGARNFPV